MNLLVNLLLRATIDSTAYRSAIHQGLTARKTVQD